MITLKEFTEPIKEYHEFMNGKGIYTDHLKFILDVEIYINSYFIKYITDPTFTVSEKDFSDMKLVLEAIMSEGVYDVDEESICA